MGEGERIEIGSLPDRIVSSHFLRSGLKREPYLCFKRPERDLWQLRNAEIGRGILKHESDEAIASEWSGQMGELQHFQPRKYESPWDANEPRISPVLTGNLFQKGA